MNPSLPTSTEFKAGRAWRFAATALLALIAAGVFVLGLAAAIPFLRVPLLALAGWKWFGEQEPGLAGFAVLGLVLLAAFLTMLLAAWRLLGRSWFRIALGGLVLGAMLAYLAQDDPVIRRPLTLEELSPPFPGAEASFRVLMRYGKDQPLAKNFRTPKFKDPYPILSPEPAGKWRQTITTHRAELEQHWTEFAAERAWWMELNAFDRIGDLTPARVDAEILGFQVVRTLSQHGIAIASLRALDGQGDAAVDTLLPVLGVGRKLQPGSRTLVRAMIGIVIEHISQQTAGFILDTTAVSPSAKARLAAALGGAAPEAGVRQLLETEYAFHLNALGNAPLGELCEQMNSTRLPSWRRSLLNAAGPFLYHPRATFNRLGDLYADLQELAAHRQIKAMEARMQRLHDEDARPGLRNLYGTEMLQAMVPAYTKVAEAYWRNQDERAALLARLARP